jgi:cellulose synthase/poly-beta-1,6-N-acetylglucosamine synthase-like glycosyltransferase
MALWLNILLSAAAIPAFAAAAYLCVLTVASRRTSLRTSNDDRLKFDVVIPAHNEESGITETIRSALAIDYDRRLFRVVVIADNCTDRTADRAEQAGADVLVRHAPHARGKGYALAHAFEHCLKTGFADIVVVVDADTVVSANLLATLAAHARRGAQALQADYRVANPTASWRTRLMSLAFTAFHTVRSLGREQLGCSCGLRGNGMAFTMEVLQHVPHRAFSVVEDLEYGIALGRAGIRVEYVPEARVSAMMCATGQNARAQRERWERGRALLIKRHAVALLRDSWRTRDIVLFDLALDLLMPPIATVVALNLATIAICIVAALFGQPLQLASWLSSLTMLGLVLHVARSWQISELGLRSLTDLVWVPSYLVWKLVIGLSSNPRSQSEWIRTTREPR